MPPKKKEKKGSATGRKPVDEPPQPTPDAPFCLTFLVEVCLDAGESGPHPSTSALRADDVADPRVKGGEGTCGIGDQPPLLVNPVFRYTFVNGDRITTPAVGLAGSSWTKADTHNAANVAGAQEVGGGLFAGAGRASKTVSSDGQQVDGVGSGGSTCVVWRYRRMHQLQGANDEEVALTLDRNPFMQVSLADASTHGATAQPPGPGTHNGNGDGPAADVNTDVHKPTISGRNFIESWHLDLSAFLAGESRVDIFIGQNCGDTQVDCSRHNDFRRNGSSQQQGEHVNIVADVMSTGVDDGLSDRRADAPPAPLGIRHLHLSVCVSGPDAVESPAEGEKIPEGKGNKARKLFSEEAMHNLNPLSITVTSANSLPGVRIEAPALQKYVQPSQFSLLEKYCRPVYIVCQPFPDDPLFGSLHARIVSSALSAQGPRARFGHTSAFLMGPLDRHRLEEWVANFSLSVEVHDRDPAPSDKEKWERTLRLERMVIGGYPTELGCSSSADDKSKDGNNDYGDAEGREAVDTVVKAPFDSPRDIYEVDALALRDAMDAAASAGRECAHGVASFRLSGLLDQSRQLVAAYNKANEGHPTSSGQQSNSIRPTKGATRAVIDVAPTLKMRAEICQRKRREIPKGGMEDWHLSEAERFVRWPGAYLDAGSSLGIRLSLARPLRTLQEGSAECTGPATEKLRPFTRAVYVVEYEQGGALMREVTAAMNATNGRALGNVQGSLQAYQLTEEEKEAVDSGSLDVVCGFMVIDEDSRTIVVEGLGGVHGGLSELVAAVGRAVPNGQGYRALENPEVRFAGRLYTSFGTDLKKVRLRETLPVLCRNPEIYDRSKVSADCFYALHFLMMLRKVDRMREAAEHGLFPKAAQLVQAESKYGESISVKDITGNESTKRHRSKHLLNSMDELHPAVARTEATINTNIASTGEKSDKAAQQPARRKAATDAKNEQFEEWLRNWQPRNFLAERDEVSLKIYDAHVGRCRRRKEELREETVPMDWCYSTQKLNYVELKKAEMRERLSRNKAANYTYSVDYVSQTVSMVDESRIRKDQEAQNRAAWKTKRGFVWPCPRTRQELVTHPNKPSESRIDTLREPWIENELTGGREDQEPTTHERPQQDLAWRPEFDTIPSNGRNIFGGLKLPKYCRKLDTSLIGSRSRLPRGRQRLEKDPGFFRSVHLVGKGLAKEKEEVKRKEDDIWRSKVVVDDIDFRVGNFSILDVPLQTDRAKDILQSPVKKVAFKIVRNARLPSGKRAPLRPPPLSAFSLEPFAEPEDFTVSIRTNHRDRWAATEPSTGEKLDFYLRLHPDRMKPESQKICARLKHPAMLKSEMCGRRWETGRKREHERSVV